MSFKAVNVPDPETPLYANWSEFGEWSVSLMGLSARDPVFHSQVESERDRHPGVDPTDIDNICYSCHGAMGQKQITAQPVGGQNQFNHYMIYSTPDNFHPTAPPYDKPGAGREFAHIGALARDGISCEVCHHVGLGTKARGKVDWGSFYGGASAEYKVRETTGEWANEGGFDYPFTSNFEYNLEELIVPDDGVENTEEPMHLQGLAPATKENYIRRSEM